MELILWPKVAPVISWRSKWIVGVGVFYQGEHWVLLACGDLWSMETWQSFSR